MRTIKDLNIDGKRVFIRCDFNVPQDEFGNITDDRRIRAALQTIRYCIDRDCKVILASHAGRPKAGEYNEKFSLKVVEKRLNTLLKIKKALYIATDVIGTDAKEKAKSLEAGEVLLLENLRFEEGETIYISMMLLVLVTVNMPLYMLSLTSLIETTEQQDF